MITKKLDNGAAVEITTNAGFLHDGKMYEAYLTYNAENRRIGLGAFQSINNAITNAIYWHKVERTKK